MYRWPYGTSRQSNTVLMIQDAAQPISYWNNFMSYPVWEGVIMDKHIYQVFTNDASVLGCNQLLILN